MPAPPLRHFIGTLLVGAFASYLAITDIAFTRSAVKGTATVMGTTNGAVGAVPGRSGRTFADAAVFVGGKRVEATIAAWYRLYRVGESVPVLYLRSRPEELIPDEFWQAHFAPLLGLAFFLLVAFGEWYTSRERRRRRTRSILLGD